MSLFFGIVANIILALVSAFIIVCVGMAIGAFLLSILMSVVFLIHEPTHDRIKELFEKVEKESEPRHSHDKPSITEKRGNNE